MGGGWKGIGGKGFNGKGKGKNGGYYVLQQYNTDTWKGGCQPCGGQWQGKGAEVRRPTALCQAPWCQALNWPDRLNCIGCGSSMKPGQRGLKAEEPDKPSTGPSKRALRRKEAAAKKAEEEE